MWNQEDLVNSQIQGFWDTQENVRYENVLVDLSWILHHCWTPNRGGCI